MPRLGHDAYAPTSTGALGTHNRVFGISYGRMAHHSRDTNVGARAWRRPKVTRDKIFDRCVLFIRKHVGTQGETRYVMTNNENFIMTIGDTINALVDLDNNYLIFYQSNNNNDAKTYAFNGIERTLKHIQPQAVQAMKIAPNMEYGFVWSSASYGVNFAIKVNSFANDEKIQAVLQNLINKVKVVDDDADNALSLNQH